MKKYLYLFLFLLTVLSSCQSDILKIEPQKPKYDLSDSETDPVQHLRYVFYKNYNVIIIDKVDSTDFMFTLSSEKLALKMEPSSKSVAEKVALIQAIENTFYKNYSSEFVKNYAPVRLIIADDISMMERDPYGAPGDMIKKNYPYYLNNTLLAISTKEPEFVMKDNLVYFVDNNGQENRLDNILVDQIVIKNILRARYGEEWPLLFVDILGSIKTYLSANSVSFRVDFDDRYVDPNNPNHPLRRPSAEYPGLRIDSPKPLPNQNFEAMEAYFNRIGLPNLKYRLGSPRFRVLDPNDPSRFYARVQFSIEEIVSLWIEWSGKYSEAEKQQKFNQYPELYTNYNKVKVLLKRYANIDI